MSTGLDVGTRLRKARIERGFVIDDVSAATGLSRAYISQVETGKASPSLQTIHKLAKALGVGVASLFVSDIVPCHIVRAQERLVLHHGPVDAPAGHRKLIHFMSAPNRALELVMLEFPAGTVAGDAAHAHEGEEVFYVLEGRLRAVQGDASFTLDPGDSLHWDATVAHTIENVGSTTARVMVARTPAGFLDLRFDEPDPDSVARGARNDDGGR